MNPAERLTAAADRMEALDDEAYQGPWRVQESEIGDTAIVARVDEVAVVFHDPNGNLIAALRPLAPLIAQQLRDAATYASDTTEVRGDSVWHYTEHCDTRILMAGKRPEPPYGRCTCFDPALALADAILGPA